MMHPPMLPTLEDDAVLLRPLVAADRGALYAVASDPAIWALHPAHDRWQKPVFDEFFDDGLASNGALAIVDKATERVFGTSRYDIRVCEAGEVEIGWTFLARDYWGGAWNRRIKRLMVGHALERYDAAIFLVGATNLRSCRAMEKIGAVLTDRRQCWPMAGVDVEHLIYAIDRDSFSKGPLSRP